MVTGKLIEAAEVRALAERSFATLEEQLQLHENFYYDFNEFWAAAESAMAGIRFACVAAGHLRDPELFDVLLRAAETLGDIKDIYRLHEDAVSRGLQGVVAGFGSQIPETAVEPLRQFVRHRWASVRVALARTLPVHDTNGLKLLQALSEDPAAQVREAVRKTLAGRTHCEAWRGVFSNDPLIGLEPGDPLQKTIERFCQISNMAPWVAKDFRDELVTCLDALPVPLKIEAIHLAVSGLGNVFAPIDKFLPILASSREGRSSFPKLVIAWGQHGFSLLHESKDALVRLPADIRVDLSLVLLNAAAEAPEDSVPLRVMAGLATALFPADADRKAIRELQGRGVATAQQKRDLYYALEGLAKEPVT